tara:strand:- start:6993 stop:7898 length:906 start_codon:yes stop_codon:yes gene_type:complete
LKKFKPGIVIQGPLISTGRTPKTESIPIPNLTINDIVEFNCTNLLNQICKEYSSKFFIVIATWKTEDQILIQKIKKLNSDKVKIVLLDDITPKISPLKAIVPGNNKYRQIYSTLKGAEKLEELGCSHVIKLRTDMRLDVLMLWDEFIKIKKKRNLKVLVPSLSLSSPSQIPDLYMVTETKILIDFFRKLIQTKPWFFSIHYEIFYRWLNTEKKISRIFIKIFEGTKVLNNLYLYAWSNFFAPASLNVFLSIIWRGEKYEYEKIRKRIFTEDLENHLKLYKNPFKLKSFSDKLLNKLFKYKI